MSYNLFDLHCDTAYEIYKRGCRLKNNNCDICLDGTKKYESYAQIAAVWTDNKITYDEAYSQFFKIQKCFLDEIDKNPSTALCKTANDYKKAQAENKTAFFLGCEGASLLNGEINRLDALYNAGVRFLTLVWGGITCMGGSFENDEPLSEFGIEVVRRCFELGITVDTSHSNTQIISQVYELAKSNKKPFIATHSNSLSVCNHQRNLLDDDFAKIKECGGIVGISLCPKHLCDTTHRRAKLSDIIAHISHYLEIGGEDILCLGCDLDGISSKPQEIYGISDIYKIADEMIKTGIGEAVVDKIIYKNAHTYTMKNLK